MASWWGSQWKGAWWQSQSSGSGSWSWSGSGDWRGGGGGGGGGVSPETDTGKSKGQGQGGDDKKGEGQGQGGDGKKGKGQGQGGDGISLVQGAEEAAGGGKSPGGKDQLGGKTGQEFVRAKGEDLRRQYLQAQQRPAETDAGRKRQAKNRYYAEKARSSGLSLEDLEPMPHAISIPWPYKYKDMGEEFMSFWKKEGDDRGFSLRLSGWRNSQWREASDVCATMFRLRITQKDKLPDAAGAVELFFEFAKAAREQGFKADSLPWEQIIEWWDGED